MKIAYFTTALSDQKFEDFIIGKKLPCNTSNQSFHSKMIRCLSENNEVYVVSCNKNIPADGFENENVYSVNWFYLKNVGRGLISYFSQKKQTKNLPFKPDVVFTDTINFRGLILSKRYARRNHVKLIGIATDNPFCLSDSSRFFAPNMVQSANCKGYIALTSGLDNLYNSRIRPYVIIKGLGEKADLEDSSPLSEPYFFYAGTLLPRFGIIDLIDSFLAIKSNAKLVIAGHHENQTFLDKIKGHENIIYPGTIPNSTAIKYENHSIANINPRPYDSTLDAYSIPSKVIEYSFSNSLAISTVSNPLKKDLEDNVIWVDKNLSLTDALNKALLMEKEERKTLINKMNEIAEKCYSFKSANEKINELFGKVIK